VLGAIVPTKPDKRIGQLLLKKAEGSLKHIRGLRGLTNILQAATQQR